MSTVKKVVKKKIPATTEISDMMILLAKEGNLVLSRKNEVVTPLGLIEDQDIINYFQEKTNVSTGLVEKNTIYYERINKNGVPMHVYVFEFDPKIYHVKHIFEYGPNPGKIHDFGLSLPFVQFYVAIKDFNSVPCLSGYAYISCTHKSIKSTSDEVFATPLHNVQSYGAICWGNSPLPKASSETPNSYAKKLAIHFFTLRFNCHLTPKFPKELLTGSQITMYDKYRNAEKLFEYWNETSMKDPSFILGTTLQKYDSNKTFQNLLDQVKNGT